MSFAEFIVRFSAFGIYDLFENGLIRRITAAGEPGSWQNALAIGIGVVLCIVVSYLLGSINTALIISKRLFKDDIREHGSGNAGTTNVLRTYGKKPAIITFVGDSLKGVLAVVLACVIFGHPISEYSYFHLITAAYLAAFFCILTFITGFQQAAHIKECIVCQPVMQKQQFIFSCNITVCIIRSTNIYNFSRCISNIQQSTFIMIYQSCITLCQLWYILCKNSWHIWICFFHVQNNFNST
jgi:acyl-phosphate glycerol 3-phosphate acyltransferase